jgi:hypothetical protein
MRKAIIGSVLMLVVGLLASMPAVAQNNATVYVVHGINGTDLGLPKAAGVDVSVSGGCALTDFEYGTITDGIALPPGKYDIVISLADASNPCGGAVVIEASIRLRHEETASIVAYLDASGTPTAAKFRLDRDQLRGGLSRFYVAHTANAPDVDVTFRTKRQSVKHAAAIDNLANGEYDRVTLSGNVWKARIFAAQDGPKVLGPLKLKLTGGLVYVVYAVGTFANGTFDLLVQAIPIP